MRDVLAPPLIVRIRIEFSPHGARVKIYGTMQARQAQSCSAAQMSTPTSAVLALLPTATDHPQAASPPSSGGPAAPKSLLDDWEHWPENNPDFDPAFDGAWSESLRREFCTCKRKKCSYCSETRKVFHVTECNADGQILMDQKVDTNELHEHLRQLEQLDNSASKAPNYPNVRLFFSCGNYTDGGLGYAYMRHFLSYCRFPPHFVLRLKDQEFLPVFQSAYEPKGASNTPSKPQGGILHIYLQCSAYMRNTDILANPEYYSSEFESDIREWIEGSGFAVFSPSLYLRYDEASQERVVYVADDGRTFHHIRNIFSTGAEEAKRDPFLLVGTFLQYRVAELHRYVLGKQTRIKEAISHASVLASLDRDSSALFEQFRELGTEGPDNARMAHEVSSMLRALQVIEAEYQLFLERDGDAHCLGDSARMLRLRFQRQRAHLVELESALSALVKGVEIVKDVMAGRAQVLNGIDMAKMARDNQKQAVATETLARDARHDSEIMKTITVVTLVYLPATFVSTLLSMGLFSFGVPGEADGRLRIAREGWVFLAIALPLTALTLALAWVRNWYKERKWRRAAAEAAPQQEKPSASNGDAAPHTHAVAHAASGDDARASRWEPLLARLPYRRRRSAPPADLESGKTAE